MTEKLPNDNGTNKVSLEAPLFAKEGQKALELVLALTVSYNGSGFAGFARQPNQSTVQGELEHALELLLRREVKTVGAGRTDAGVHARGQVVSFSLTTSELEKRSLDKLRSSLNALTPDGLVVSSIVQKPVGFSARFSALERTYRYRIVHSPVPPVFLEPYAWWVPTSEYLNVTAMKQAARYVEGEHDFKTFCVAKSAEGQTTMRCINEIFLFGIQHFGEQCLIVQIKGNAFLHSMVRVLVGSLVEVGLERKRPEWMRDILLACDRRAAGQTAPAHGLTLWEVRY